jgi:hypothetical protein
MNARHSRRFYFFVLGFVLGFVFLSVLSVLKSRKH